VKTTQIHRGKTPKRRHYINEWAEHYGISKAEIARKTGAERSLVSKWFDGVMPGEKYIDQLAAIFDTQPEGLFRHPDDDWLARFLQDRKIDRERAREVLEAVFPKKTGTDD